jgi:molybdopterin/thiamine biosynthesis adenylyltransferase
VAGRNKVEALRHQKVFQPADFGERRIDVIGCGATGSRIAMQLAKLGIQVLHLWDFDEIAEHNVANQIYGISDIGKKKVDALAAMIHEQTGLDVVPHDERVTGKEALGDVVFLLTDTMASRKEIWDGAIKNKPTIERMIETRMGSSEGRVYSVSPYNPADVKYWESTLCDDDEATDSLCGARVSVGPTAELVSGYAVWAFIRWFKWINSVSDKPEPESELLFFAENGLVTTHTPDKVGILI